MGDRDASTGDGDTLFVDGRHCFTALPMELRSRLVRLTARHEHPGTADPTNIISDDTMSVRPGWRHPVVRRHPETAELCLYVNPSYVVPDSLQHEDGSCVADSAKLLESVYAACLGSDAQSQP